MAKSAPEDRQSGDLALARLINTFMPYIQKKADSLKAQGLDSEDLVQEGLIGLFNALETYSEERGARFSTYAIACINNGIKTALRQAARLKHVPLNSALPLSEQEEGDAGEGYSPEELAIAAEGYAALTSQINSTLSDFEREVLVLLLEGYDYKAAAERLGSTPKSVDNAIQRARRKLKPGR